MECRRVRRGREEETEEGREGGSSALYRPSEERGSGWEGSGVEEAGGAVWVWTECGEVRVVSWEDGAEEVCLEDEQDWDDVERLRQGARRGEMDGRLGLYPLRTWSVWRELSGSIGSASLERLLPRADRLRAMADRRRMREAAIASAAWKADGRRESGGAADAASAAAAADEADDLHARWHRSVLATSDRERAAAGAGEGGGRAGRGMDAEDGRDREGDGEGDGGGFDGGEEGEYEEGVERRGGRVEETGIALGACQWLRFPRIAGSDPHQSSPAEVTAFGVDPSGCLDRMWREEWGGSGREGAAELQVAFLTFFVAHSALALTRWRALVDVVCRAEEAICSGGVDVGVLWDVIGLQIQTLPKDVFDEGDAGEADLVAQRVVRRPTRDRDGSFLARALRSLARILATCEYVPRTPVSPALVSAGFRLLQCGDAAFRIGALDTYRACVAQRAADQRILRNADPLDDSHNAPHGSARLWRVPASSPERGGMSGGGGDEGVEVASIKDALELRASRHQGPIFLRSTTQTTSSPSPSHPHSSDFPPSSSTTSAASSSLLASASSASPASASASSASASSASASSASASSASASSLSGPKPHPFALSSASDEDVRLALASLRSQGILDDEDDAPVVVLGAME